MVVLSNKWDISSNKWGVLSNKLDIKSVKKPCFLSEKFVFSTFFTLPLHKIFQKKDKT